MASKLPRTMPIGRLDDLRSRDDADLIAITYGTSIGDVTVKRYASRKALFCFCKDGSKHHALVKDQVHPTMLVNRNTQARGMEVRVR